MKLKYAQDVYGETRFATMISLIEEYASSPDKTVVDLGAGQLSISSYVASAKTIRLDFEDTYDPDICCDFSEKIPLDDESCDLVIAGEILEHMYASIKFVSEINRILRPGGQLILSVPNMGFIFYRIAWLFGIVPPLAAKADHTYDPPGDIGGHVRDYNFAEVEGLLRRNGYEIVKSATNGVIFKNLYLPKWLYPKTLGQKVIVMARKV